MVPTKPNRAPVAVGFTKPPQAAIEHSAFFDEEAEAVRLKAEELQREEDEQRGMEEHDKAPVPPQEELPPLPQGQQPVIPEVMADSDDEVPMTRGSMPSGEPSSSSAAAAPSSLLQLPATPRVAPSGHTHDAGDDGPDQKRLKMSESKKQRLERLSAECIRAASSIDFGDYEYASMDAYDADLQIGDIWGSCRDQSLG